MSDIEINRAWAFHFEKRGGNENFFIFYSASGARSFFEREL